jgi:hypothetical protein
MDKNPETAAFLQRTLFGHIKEEIYNKKCLISKMQLEIGKKHARIEDLEEEITLLEHDLEESEKLIEAFGGVPARLMDATLEEQSKKERQPELMPSIEDMF